MVSVITPLADGCRLDWLERVAKIHALNSVPVEWIVVASEKEHSRIDEILPWHLLSSYKSVAVESTKNVASARNAGLAVANEVHSMQFDADDIPLPFGIDQVLMKMADLGTRWGGGFAIDFFEDRSFGFAVPNEWKFFVKDRIRRGRMSSFRRVVRDDNSSRFPVGMYPVHPSSAIVETELALNVGGWDESMPILEDFGFLGRVAALEDGAWTKDPCFLYRKQDVSESTKKLSHEEWSNLDKYISNFENMLLGDIQ